MREQLVFGVCGVCVCAFMTMRLFVCVCVCVCEYECVSVSVCVSVCAHTPLCHVQSIHQILGSFLPLHPSLGRDTHPLFTSVVPPLEEQNELLPHHLIAAREKTAQL